MRSLFLFVLINLAGVMSLVAQKPPLHSAESATHVPAAQDSIATSWYVTPGTFYLPKGNWADTLDANYHRYDPARRAEYPYATLGNLGSPARRLYFELPISKGLNLGHNAFDLYKFRFPDFRFYDTDIALTKLEYSQGIGQNDALLRADFGRNFAKGINFSLNYIRVNQAGPLAINPAQDLQRTKNTSLGAGILYRSPGGKLDGLYHYLTNSIVHDENGGLENIADIDNYENFENIPIRLLNASTLHRMREGTIQHHLHLLNASQDSIQRKADLDLIHTLRYGMSFVKFADPDIAGSESAYYETFITDVRGIRNFIHAQTFDNQFDVQFRYHPSEADIPAHLLRAGVQLRNQKVDHEPEQYNRTELFANITGQLGITSKVSIDGNGYIGFLDATGEYRLNAHARLRLFKDATTWVQANLFQRQPTLLEERLYISQLPVWNFEFDNIAQQSLEFHYRHPSFRLNLHGAAHVISNYIFFDSTGAPVQLSESVEVLQVSCSKEVSLGPVGILGHLMLQQIDRDEIGLPQIIFNGQLYFSDRIFRDNLLIRTGFDVLWTDDYTGSTWMPVTGQFLVDDAFAISQYPAIDFFFAMDVDHVFRAFVKMDNITAFWSTDHYVQIAHYPQNQRYFRFGLSMRLSN